MLSVKVGKADISRSYCLVCLCIWEGNPQALSSGLSPVQKQNYTVRCLLHQHLRFMHGEMFDVNYVSINKGAIMWYIGSF